jgi:hypothetical protein
MSLKQKLPYITSILITTTIVGLYQLPNIENTLNKYGFALEINDNIPYAKNFQQSLEDYKIAFSSSLDNKSTVNINKPTIQLAQISLKQEDNKQNIQINNSEKTVARPHDNESINKQQVNEVSVCKDKCTVLMLGDSVMGDVSFAFQRLLKKQQPSWNVVDAHKVSSGLSNQTYYNWPLTAKKLIQEHRPDYIFILVGTNDAQNFASNGKAHPFGKDDWKEAYGNRVQQMSDLFKLNKNMWGWIELPLVRDTGFNSRLQVIRNVQNDLIKENIVETETIFGKTDHSGIVDMKLRAGDGTHLSATGANLLAQHLYTKVKNNIEKKLTDDRLSKN